MANYDDFDLDIRKIKGNMEAEPKGTAAICLTTGTATTCTMPTLCDTSIVTLASCDGTCVGCTNTEKPCSANTCSAWDGFVHLYRIWKRMKKY